MVVFSGADATKPTKAIRDQWRVNPWRSIRGLSRIGGIAGISSAVEVGIGKEDRGAENWAGKLQSDRTIVFIEHVYPRGLVKTRRAIQPS
jgi:hypothetical protein